MANTKPTLERLVTRYRREAAVHGATPELEVRFQDVDAETFAAVYASLAADPAGEPTLTTVVSVLAARTPADSARAGLRAVRVRELRFARGVRAGESISVKEPLEIPWRAPPGGGGHPYIVALSSERPEAHGFSADTSTVLRAKARVSFPLSLTGRVSDGVGQTKLSPDAAAAEWRVDMTVTRQFAGADAAALKPALAHLFPPDLAVGNFLARTTAAAAALDGGVHYEIEAEFVGADRDALRPADVLAAAAAVQRHANPGHAREAALRAVVARAARYVGASGAAAATLRRLLPQAVSITRAEYRAIYPPDGYYLTDKADGRRALAVAGGGAPAAVAADVLYDGFASPGRGADDAPETIVDGELVGGSQGGPLAFYAFDVIACRGEDLTGADFGARLARLDEAVAALVAAGVPAAAKAYRHLGAEPAGLEADVRAALAAHGPTGATGAPLAPAYTTDGLILVEPGRAYSATASYKWKDAADNTVDFLARRAPAAALAAGPPFVDRPGAALHFLFVGASAELRRGLGLQWCHGYAQLFPDAGAYAPVQFAPSDAPLAYLYWHPDDSPLGPVDGAVVEARCAGGCAAAGGAPAGGPPTVDWELTRVRSDRARDLRGGGYYGNDFRTAEMVWLNYVDPFPVEQLWAGPGADDYFLAPKSGVYRAQTAVISYVKSQRIATLRHADWVVDVGAGKGQDLGRYLDAEVRHLVAVDRDRAALSELVRRKYNFALGRDDQARGGPRARRPAGAAAATGTAVRVLAADANDPADATTSRLRALGLPAAGADALVCNLAVHYFLGDVAALRNFVALAAAVVRPGGRVALTVLRGEAVHAAFTAGRVPFGGTWDAFENGARKYSLKRLYAADTLEAAGQRVGVLLPFSDGRYYEEFLVNTTALAAEFAARGFAAVPAAATVADAVGDFTARNRPVAATLTPGDLTWLALYGELVFRREA